MKVRDKLKAKLKMEVMELTDKVSNPCVQVDKQEQYSRCNCLLIHAVNENRNEDYITLSISIINEHLGLHVEPSDVN